MAGSFALGDDGYSGFFLGKKERMKVEGYFLFLENKGVGSAIWKKYVDDPKVPFQAADKFLQPRRAE
ncbi:hypothetical protein [Burkholderia gladioli]|uniref:hypothetical protein n=1 Tax=Burkholderia gladioli TaxID=28095 RepID=UPI00163F3FF4|nr:hypothetical protein [Burkholderia gladioli]